MVTNDKPMTISECERKHKTTWLALTLLGGFMVCFLVCVGWSVRTGYSADKNSTAVGSRLTTHEKVQIEQMMSINEKLSRIEKSIEGLTTAIHDGG